MSQARKNIAIIPAAGLGTRFSAEIPKQLVKINSSSLLEKTIKIFLDLDQIDQIIVPINSLVKKATMEYETQNSKIKFVDGGDTRAESVYAALKHISEEAVVIVHDAVRPFIHSEDVLELLKFYETKDSDIVVYGIPVYESLKKINKETLEIEKSVDRNDYYLAQTPQITTSTLLKNALEECLRVNFFPSDECEAIERNGGSGVFISGSRKNIKITVPEDLDSSGDYIFGNGFDSHRYCKGDGLFIGGFKVPYNFSFDAHSDGDIVLHALIDSMLSALGLGDIGTNFPSTKEWENAPGEKLFRIAYEKVKNKGYRLSQFDVIVIAEEPKLSSYRDAIIEQLSTITNVSKIKIGFKAKTAEKMGFIGNNEGAAAMVISKLTK